MSLSVGMITVDSLDARSLGRWWAEQVGGEIVQENDGWFVVVAVPGSPHLAFQKVERPTPGKNKIHLDLVAQDLDTEVERLEGVGAEQVATQTMGDFRWVTLADPEGNYFDVSGPEAPTEG